MKKNKEPKQDTLPSVVIGTGSTDSSRSTLIGQEISINLKKESYFGVGSIWLTPERYWAEIPEDCSDEDLALIQRSIDNGIIVKGKKYIPPVDRVSNVKEKYWALIEREGFKSKQAKSAFNSLIKKGTDEGWTTIEIAQYCLERERAARMRKEVVSTLEQLVQSYDGPITLYDPPDDAEGIKKVIVKSDGTVEAETNSGKKVANTISARPPEGHVRGNKSSEEAINDILS